MAKKSKVKKPRWKRRRWTEAEARRVVATYDARPWGKKAAYLRLFHKPGYSNPTTALLNAWTKRYNIDRTPYVHPQES